MDFFMNKWVNECMERVRAIKWYNNKRNYGQADNLK